MGDGLSGISQTRRDRFQRRQSLTAVYAVMAALLMLILMQFLLLTVAMDDYLSGHRSLLWGAAAGSGLCFAGACRLIGLLTPGRRPGK
jgi:hypothetical protein